MIAPTPLERTHAGELARWIFDRARTEREVRELLGHALASHRVYVEQGTPAKRAADAMVAKVLSGLRP